MNHYEFGLDAELRAESYLVAKGYEILDRRFRTRQGEIDLICIDRSGEEEEIVFVEVKARRSLRFGSPADAVTSKKVKRLLRTAEIYLHLHPRPDAQPRFDMVTFREGPSSVKLSHLIGAIQIQDTLG